MKKEMDELTKEALKGSIEKWENIVNNEGIDKGSTNCPLCHLFHETGSCKGCPIYSKTGNTNCYNTPYEKWNDHQWNVHHKYTPEVKIYCSVCEKFAKEELKFLKSLLPKETPKEIPKYYLKIKNPEVAIGEDTIKIMIVDKKGNRVSRGNLMYLGSNGKLNLCTSVSPIVNLKLDPNDRIIVEE